jgi:hypothetical protein
MARKGSPANRDNRECRDKRGIQAKLVTRGKQATPDDRVTRVIREIRDKRATPDDRVTRVIREIRDKRATPAIEASPVHAPTDSITLLILTERYTAWKITSKTAS